MKEFNFSKVADLKRATLMKNWTLLQVFFDQIFWLVLAQLHNGFFVEHLPVAAAFVRCLKEKEWKKWNSVFIALSLTFFFVALQDSVGEIRTN